MALNIWVSFLCGSRWVLDTRLTRSVFKMRFEGASIRGSSSNRSEMRVKLLSTLVIISQKSMMLFLIFGWSAVIDQISRSAPIKLKFSQLVRIQKCITVRCLYHGLLQYSGSYRWNLTRLWKPTRQLSWKLIFRILKGPSAVSICTIFVRYEWDHN